MPEYFPISDATFYRATVALFLVCVLLFWVLGYDFRRAPAYLWNNGRWIVLNALLLIVAVHALMLAPAPPAGSHCVEVHHVWGPLRMVLSCDSYEFIRGAMHPAYLSRLGSFRQSRPLEITVASLLRLVELPNPTSHSHAATAEQDPSPDGKHQTMFHRFFGYAYGFQRHGWFPFVVLNFVILLVALMVFKRLTAPAGSAAAIAVAVLGVFIAFSDVVKGFFWSAHTQMWNVLMPLISISLAAAFIRRPDRSWAFITATGFLLGIGMLAYPSLVVCIPAVAVSMAAGFWMNKQRPKGMTFLGKIALLASTAAAPMLIWISIITRLTGTFTNPEASTFREFVWISDAWKVGGAEALCRQTVVFVGEFLIHLWNELWPGLILLTIALIHGLIAPGRLKATIRDRSAVLVGAGITFLTCLPFFALMGFYRDRLAFNVAAPFFIIASVILTGLIERAPTRQRISMISVISLAAAGSITAALVRITWPY